MATTSSLTDAGDGLKSLAGEAWSRLWVHALLVSRMLAAIALLLCGCWVLSGWARDHAAIVAAGNASYDQLSLSSIHVGPGADTVIGAAELGQDQQASSFDSGQLAEAKHIAFRVRNGRLYLSSVAEKRKTALRLANDEMFSSDRWRLERGLSVELGTSTLDVADADANGFRFGLTGQDGHSTEYAYTAHSDRLTGPNLSSRECRSSRQSDVRRGLKFFERLFSNGDRPVVRIGGRHACTGSYDLPSGMYFARNIYTVPRGDWPWRAMTISAGRRGEYWISSSADAQAVQGTSRIVPPHDGLEGARGDFRDAWWQVDAKDGWAITHVVAGRTDYQISTRKEGNGFRVDLRPFRAITLLSHNVSRSCPSAGGAGQCYSRYTWFAQAPHSLQNLLLKVVIFLTALALFLRGLVAQRRARPNKGGSIYLRLREVWRALGNNGRLVPLIGLSVLLSFWSELGYRADTIWPVALNWMLLGAVLLATARSLLSLMLWFSIALLASTGALTMAALTVSFGTTRLTDNFFAHRTLVLDVIPPLLIMIALSPIAALRWLNDIALSGLRPRQVQSLGRLLATLQWKAIVKRILKGARTLFLPLTLLALMAVGTETGIAGLQVAEFGKFAVACLAAMLFSYYDAQMRAAGGRNGLLVISFIVIVYGLLLMIAPAFRSDYSPVLILAMTLMLTAFVATTLAALSEVYFIYRCERYADDVPMRMRSRFSLRRLLYRKNSAFVALYAAILIAVCFVLPRMLGWASELLTQASRPAPSVAVLHEQLKGAMYTSLGLEKIRERFLLWSEMNMSPSGPAPVLVFGDLDNQVVRSRVVIDHGACAEAVPTQRRLENEPWSLVGSAYAVSQVFYGHARTPDPMVKGCTPPQRSVANAAPARPRSALDYGADTAVPVVATDFMAAFLIGRFGLRYAFLVFVGQLLFVLSVALIAIRLWLAPPAGEGIVGRVVCRVCAAIVAATSSVFVSQWILSWCNILGLLPVMGQPMTWLSFGTSHHLFMAVPTVTVIFIALRRLELMLEPPRWQVPP